jgi:hypothetical protein
MSQLLSAEQQVPHLILHAIVFQTQAYDIWFAAAPPAHACECDVSAVADHHQALPLALLSARMLEETLLPAAAGSCSPVFRVPGVAAAAALAPL